MDTLDEINAGMVIADWTHLRKVKRVLAVAGGPLKLRVIWTLLIAAYLKPERRIVTEICTDETVAADVVQAMQTYLSVNRRDALAGLNC